MNRVLGRAAMASMLGLVVVVAAIESSAAIKNSNASLEVKSTLEKPLSERIKVLRAQGDAGYAKLVGTMFDKTANMETRWRAVTAVGLLRGAGSRPDLEKALASDEWFMRNAALVALSNVDRRSSIPWARKLLSDPALMVRWAAVDTISNLRDDGALPLLWEKLNAPENFRAAQSLFIRRRIVETLAALEKKGRENKFIEILKDRDESLHPIATAALECLTGVTLGTAEETFKTKKDRWLKWWSERDARKVSL